MGKKEVIMKKMLLTSNGLSTPKIKEVFNEMIESDIKKAKVLFIPTASRTEDEMIYVKKTYDELISAGIISDNILEFDINKCLADRNYYDSHDIDCFVVCGGNTYYLLSKLKESGFLSKMKESVNKNILYVGVSAGSVIASPSIAHVSFLDENDIKLEDFSALGLVDEQIVPHYETSFDSRMDHEGSFMCIRDCTALQIRGNIRSIV